MRRFEWPRVVARWTSHAMFVVVTTPLLVFAIVESFAERPWRVSALDPGESTSQGESVYVRELAYSALPEGSRGHTMIWETCLHLADDSESILQLVANREARLTVDGREVLAIHSLAAKKARGFRLHLERGRHVIRLEHTFGPSTPVLALNASFRGELPTALAGVLRGPGAGRTPCE